LKPTIERVEVLFDYFERKILIALGQENIAKTL
jgi:hypothetical protein